MNWCHVTRQWLTLALCGVAVFVHVGASFLYLSSSQPSLQQAAGWTENALTHFYLHQHWGYTVLLKPPAGSVFRGPRWDLRRPAVWTCWTSPGVTPVSLPCHSWRRTTTLSSRKLKRGKARSWLRCRDPDVNMCLRRWTAQREKYHGDPEPLGSGESNLHPPAERSLQEPACSKELTSSPSGPGTAGLHLHLRENISLAWINIFGLMDAGTEPDSFQCFVQRKTEHNCLTCDTNSGTICSCCGEKVPERSNDKCLMAVENIVQSGCMVPQ